MNRKQNPVGLLAALAAVIPWALSLVGVDAVDPNVAQSLAFLALTAVSYFSPRNV